MVVKVTGKGRITIPADIRRKLGIQPGTRLAMREEGECIALARMIDAHAHVPACGRLNCSTDNPRLETIPNLIAF